MILSWLQIRRHYAETADSSVALKAILNLVDEITASQYADGLFAWTSMHDLCIAQTCVTYPYDGPYLRISPRDYGQLEFQYLTRRRWTNNGIAQLTAMMPLDIWK